MRVSASRFSLRHRLVTDRRASIAIMSAAFMVTAMGCAAITVDFGLFFATRTQLQTASDAAALSASMNIANASSLAAQAVRSNGFDDAAVRSVISGTYCPDLNLPPAGRFSPGVVAGCAVATGTLPNAVQVDVQTAPILAFGRLFTDQTSLNANAVSVATRIDTAGLTAGTGLARLGGGAVNAVLSNLLGTGIALDAVSYNGLLTASLPAAGFLKALAAELGMTTGVYGALDGRMIGLQTILSAEQTALAASGGSSAAIAALASLRTQVPGTAMLPLNRILDIGPWRNQPVTIDPPPAALQATVGAADMMQAAVQLASVNGRLSAPAQFIVPHIGSVTILATVVEPLQTAYFEFGPAGTAIHTAQLRMQILLNLAPSLPVNGQSAAISLPMYLELGSGDATISNIACGAQPAADATVSVLANSGLANVYIGAVDPVSMRNFQQPVVVSPATLVDAGVVRITGSSSLQVGRGTGSLMFNQTQISQGAIQTVSSTGLTSNVLQSLIDHLSLNIAVLSFGLGAGALNTQLLGVLQQVPLDSLIDGLLSALGVSVGYIDVSVPGVRCGVPALVQ